MFQKVFALKFFVQLSEKKSSLHVWSAGPHEYVANDPKHFLNKLFTKL